MTMSLIPAGIISDQMEKPIQLLIPEKRPLKPLSGQTASLKNMPLMKTEKCFTAGSMKKVSGRPVMTPGKTEYIIWARPETER